MNKIGSDVTDEYKNKATPGKGSVIRESAYDDSLHKNEIEMAQWLIKELGGDVTLIKEASGAFEISKPDYMWHDHYWELKTLSTTKSVDSALRKAIRQIHDRPGGVILDFGKNNINISSVESAIKSRLEAVCRFSIDVIIVNKEKLVKILRYR
jgi:hypothetical protein